ncbi:hypothetical protein F5880DRAFT_1702866 [Lentinula raphanica]|nr:hypothetical protein F5880DRAFT_1702866 [Lentinula raphanica]
MNLTDNNIICNSPDLHASTMPISSLSTYKILHSLLPASSFLLSFLLPLFIALSSLFCQSSMDQSQWLQQSLQTVIANNPQLFLQLLQQNQTQAAPSTPQFPQFPAVSSNPAPLPASLVGPMPSNLTAPAPVPWSFVGRSCSCTFVGRSCSCTFVGRSCSCTFVGRSL